MFARAVVLVLWAAVTTPLAAAPLFHQPLDPSISGSFSEFLDGLSSQRIADDFRFEMDSVVQDLHWYGLLSDDRYGALERFETQSGFHDHGRSRTGSRRIQYRGLRSTAATTTEEAPSR